MPTQAEIRVLLKQLVSDDAAQSDAARMALYKLDEYAVDPLADEFYSGVSMQEAAAILDVLGEIGGPDALIVLRDAYGVLETTDEIRQTAALALARNGQQEILPDMLKWLQRGDAAFRQTAALALGWLNQPKTIEALIHAMHDPEITIQAVGALERMERADALAFGYATDNATTWAWVTNALINLREAGLSVIAQALNSPDMAEQVLISLEMLDRPEAQAILDAAQDSPPTDDDYDD